MTIEVAGELKEGESFFVEQAAIGYTDPDEHGESLVVLDMKLLGSEERLALAFNRQLAEHIVWSFSNTLAQMMLLGSKKLLKCFLNAVDRVAAAEAVREEQRKGEQS